MLPPPGAVRSRLSHRTASAMPARRYPPGNVIPSKPYIRSRLHLTGRASFGRRTLNTLGQIGRIARPEVSDRSCSAAPSQPLTGDNSQCVQFAGSASEKPYQLEARRHLVEKLGAAASSAERATERISKSRNEETIHARAIVTLQARQL